MLLPLDMRDWLPDDHMVHFILDVVEAADTSGFSINQRGTGSKQYPPSMLLALLVYCYCTGRFSSRVIEEASYYDVAVRYLCADTHPDHDTICTFRRVNRKAFEQFFVHVLEVAAQSGVLKKVGTVSVDGTKIRANASKHSAVSYSHAQEMLKQLESEVLALTEQAEQCDGSQQQDCAFNLPEEISRREERKARIQKAMDVIESRHAEKLKEQKQEYQRKLAAREAKRAAGKKPRGPEPKPPNEEVPPKDQYNFTDAESRGALQLVLGVQAFQAGEPSLSLNHLGNALAEVAPDSSFKQVGLYFNFLSYTNLENTKIAQNILDEMSLLFPHGAYTKALAGEPEPESTTSN